MDERCDTCKATGYLGVCPFLAKNEITRRLNVAEEYLLAGELSTAKTILKNINEYWTKLV